MNEKLKSNKDGIVVMSNDNGMGSNKITYGLDGVYYQFDFPSMFLEVEKETPDTTVIDEKIYTFNEGKLAAANGHTTKDDEFHVVLLKKAIYEVHKRTGATVFDVVTNFSLDSYKDDKGQGVLNRMSRDKTFKVKELYKDEVELTINRIDAYAECLTGGILAPLKLKDEDVVMIDIGTKDLQLLRVVQGVPQYMDSKSIKIGMSNIYRDIKDVTQNLGEGINDNVAVKMYLEKTATGEIELINRVDDKILDSLIRKTFDEIDRCLREMGASRFTKIVLLGGGSRLLKRFLDARFIDECKKSVYYVKDAYFANSLGLFKKAERLYGYEKHILEEVKKSEETNKATTKKTTKKTTTKKSSDKKTKDKE